MEKVAKQLEFNVFQDLEDLELLNKNHTTSVDIEIEMYRLTTIYFILPKICSSKILRIPEIRFCPNKIKQLQNVTKISYTFPHLRKKSTS